MLINIPIAFYSSALLLVLHVPAPLSMIQILRSCCWVPIVVTLLVLLCDVPRRWNLRYSPQSRLYDSDGNPVVRRGNRNVRLFLPDKDHCRNEDYEKVHRSLSIAATATATASTAASTTTTTTTTSERASWALVTGASIGIGRAIAISLARRKIPLVLVARNGPKLESLAREIRECYGITAIPLTCDLSNTESIDALLETLRETSISTATATATAIAAASSTSTSTSSDEAIDDDNNKDNSKLIDRIDILINNAGLGDSCCFFEDGVANSSSNSNSKSNSNSNSNIHKMASMIHLNVLGTTRLTQAIGKAMNDRMCVAANTTNTNASASASNNHNPRGGGRIAFVSSIMGVLPGVPGSSVYAATKAYQRSLCVSMGRELESSSAGRISVVCVLPGAVTDTGFARAANMTESAVFHLFPGLSRFGLVLTPQHVAEVTVIETIAGAKREVMVGWMYFLKGAILCKLFPDRATTLLGEVVTGHVSVFESWGIPSRFLLRGSKGPSKTDRTFVIHK